MYSGSANIAETTIMQDEYMWIWDAEIVVEEKQIDEIIGFAMEGSILDERLLTQQTGHQSISYRSPVVRHFLCRGKLQEECLCSCCDFDDSRYFHQL